MTIQAAKNAILEYLLEKDFITHKDLAGMVDPGVNKDVAMSAFLLALQELNTEGVVGLNPLYSGTDNSTLIWNLKTGLPNRRQTISISGQLATSIAGIVNSFAETVDEEDISCNALELTESDLAILVDLVGIMSQNQSRIEEQSHQEEVKKKSK